MKKLTVATKSSTDLRVILKLNPKLEISVVKYNAPIPFLSPGNTVNPVQNIILLLNFLFKIIYFCLSCNKQTQLRTRYNSYKN